MADINTGKTTSLKFELSRPVTVNNVPYATLYLTKPRARSFVRHGVPYNWDVTKGDVTFDIKAMIGFASDMSGFEVETLEDIDACDVMPLCTIILSTLIPNRNVRPKQHEYL